MFDIDRALVQFHCAEGLWLQSARRFLEETSGCPRYVLGRNEQALECMKRVHIDAIVDDFAPSGSTWKGLPVVSIDSVSDGAFIVNCSTSVRPLSAHAKLMNIPGAQVLAYSDLMRVNRDFPLPAFVTSFRSDYAIHKQKWEWLESLLGDERSRAVLDALMHFRLTADLRCMRGFAVRLDEQYFDTIVALSESEVFVDCGGYDGDTVLQFCSRMEKYDHIYMFEPSDVNVKKARERLKAIENLEIIPLGVSHKKGKLSFDSSSGSASSVSLSGSTLIEVVTLDDYLSRKVTYIKMDLEGWELEALAGARRHILEDHPKLAISVYHDAADFWRVPEYICNLRSDYDVYLRHYTEGWSETVMYFIPAL